MSASQNFTTGLQPESIDFQWNIPEFAKVCFLPGTLDLQTIDLVSQDGLKWHISINRSLNSYTEDEQIILNCTLECTPALQSSQQLAIWEIYIVDASGESVLKFDIVNNIYGLCGGTLLSHMKIQRIAACWSPPVVNGTLKMKGKLTIYKPRNESTATPKVVSNKFGNAPMVKLQQNMIQLLLTANENDKVSDIKICTDDGKIILAHRGILVAQSDYFKTMLTNEMMETKTGKISVEGIKGKSMMSLLHFLYSGCLSEDWSDHEVLHDLTKAAHRYQVTDLVEFLDQNIAKVCDSRSAADLLLLCKTLEMKTAEVELRNLIKRKLKDLKDEPEFDELLYLFAKQKMDLQ